MSYIYKLSLLGQIQGSYNSCIPKTITGKSKRNQKNIRDLGKKRETEE